MFLSKKLFLKTNSLLEMKERENNMKRGDNRYAQSETEIKIEW
jgi:hypothetical protein